MFNDNFEISLTKLKNSDHGVDTSFNDVYLETCSLGSCNISELKNQKVSLWTRHLSQSQQEKIISLYPDVLLKFNDDSCDINVFTLNYFNNEELNNILNKISKNKIFLYYQNQKYHTDNNQKDKELLNQLSYYKEVLNNHISYGWWMYIRHFIIKN